MLGVSRQRVHKLTTRPDFPQPVVVLVGGTVWERAAVEKWIRKSRRDLTDNA